MGLNMKPINGAGGWAWVLLAGWLCAGCAKNSIEERRHEKWMAYSALPQEQRELVDQGQIRVGMSEEAVYIAWGKPSEVLESALADGQIIITWRYYGAWAEETRYWTYRESRRNGQPILERHLERDYNPRSYVRAEINFARGKVLNWRTLPKPLN